MEYEKLSDDRLGEPSVAIRGRVAAARERQLRGFEVTSLICNADSPALADERAGVSLHPKAGADDCRSFGFAQDRPGG